MKFLIQVIAIIIAAAILEILLPWWSIAIAAAVAGLFFRSSHNFFAGFAGIASLWIMKALWLDVFAATELTSQIAHILMVKNKVLLFLLTGLIGGLVGGFASLTGSLLTYGKKNPYR